jgi:hypothetical protein
LTSVRDHPLFIQILEELLTERDYTAMACRRILFLAGADPTISWTDEGVLNDCLRFCFGAEGMVRYFREIAPIVY